MARGDERIAWVMATLRDAGPDALVCTLPTNVLMLSGYWPVVGSAVAVATRYGRIAVLAPEDEEDLATHGWASEVRTYQTNSLTHLAGGSGVTVRDALTALLRDLGVARGCIAYEDGDAYQPSSYAAMYLYGAAATTVLRATAPDATLSSAAGLLGRLRAALTHDEVGTLRLACARARSAFEAGARRLRPGLLEPEVAAAFSLPLSMPGMDQDEVQRAGGFVYCMSGPNSALAGGAYARTRTRELRPGDLVLVHCNSYIDGYWTDITRTYCLGEPDARRRAMYEAIFAARAAALAAIQPGARAATVDRAARDVLAERGFGDHFTHGVGHSLGFSAISMEYPPRLHPASDDRLEIGMTFNLEPAIYIKGYGGMRHCDVVTLTGDGAEVLTPFQNGPHQLIAPGVDR
jgi:Xaa-Pro aminopeptidase